MQAAVDVAAADEIDAGQALGDNNEDRDSEGVVGRQLARSALAAQEGVVMLILNKHATIGQAVIAYHAYNMNRS